MFSKSCYRSLIKHLSRSPRQLEEVLLVYYQFRQISPFPVILLQFQLPHGGSVADLLLGGGGGGGGGGGAGCCPVLQDWTHQFLVCRL